MAEEIKKTTKHRPLDSVASMESEIGGHEQLKTVLIEGDEHELFGEEVMVFDTHNIIRQSGGDGNYQRLALLGLTLPAIAVFFIIVMMPAMQVTPNVLCATDDSEYRPCTIEAACEPGTQYLLDRSKSIANWVYDFGLLCESTDFLKLIYYFFFGGFFIGSTVLSPLADYFGRKGMLLLSVILLCLVHLKTVFTSDVVTCAIVLCCSGAFVGVYYCVSIAYLTEIATQEAAVIYSVMFHLSFPISGAVVAILLRYLHDWKIVTTIMSLVPLCFVVYSTYIAESPRLLASKGMYTDARYASNAISMYNTGRPKKWKFSYEKAAYMQEYVQFAEDREKHTFQHIYFLKFSSGRYYLFAFCILLYCSGFAFAGLALTQKPIFKNPFVDSLILYLVEACLLFISGFLVQAFGHIKTIGISLLCTAGLGIVCTIVLWINDYAYGVFGYLTKLFAFIAFVAAVSFAAENCPARVRTTGFGMAVGAGVLGLMSGGFVLEFYDKLHILFGIVAACGIIAFTMVKEPSMYLNNDDVHEINEMRKNNFKEEKRPKRDESRDVSPAKEIIKPEIISPPAKLEDEAVLYKIEGTRMVQGRKEPLGLILLNIHTDGRISYDGKDILGQYSLNGSLKDSNKVTIVKKYKDGKEVRYEGTLEGAKVTGTWMDENYKGEFEFAFALNLWEGTITVNGQEIALAWYLAQTGRRVYGIGETNNVAHFISGVVNESKLQLLITDENGNRTEIEGTFEDNAIEGRFPDGTLNLKAVKE